MTPKTEFHAEMRQRVEIQIQDAKGFLFSQSASPHLRVMTSFLTNVGVQDELGRSVAEQLSMV